MSDNRLSLRNWFMLLLLAGLIATLCSVILTSGSIQRKALREHDLGRQMDYTLQLAHKLEREYNGQDFMPQLERILLGESMCVYVLDPSGKVLYKRPETGEAVALPQMEKQPAQVVSDATGRDYLSTLAVIPGTSWRLLLQARVEPSAGLVSGNFSLLLYALPVLVLVLLLGWLVSGWLIMPLRALGGLLRSSRLDMRNSIAQLPGRSLEASTLKDGLIGVLNAKGERVERLVDKGQQIDAQTGLSTPEVLPELMANISMGGIGFSVIAFSIDDFPQLQEHFDAPELGQGISDLAQILIRSSRELDVSIRMSEEIFLLILPQCPGDVARRITERVCKRVSLQTFAGVGHMTVSAGVALYEPGEGDPLAALKLAQQMLIKAKNSGQNQVCSPDFPQ